MFQTNLAALCCIIAACKACTPQGGVASSFLPRHRRHEFGRKTAAAIDWFFFMGCSWHSTDKCCKRTKGQTKKLFAQEKVATCLFRFNLFHQILIKNGKIRTFIGKVVMRDHATSVSLLLCWKKKKSINNIEVGNQHEKLHKHKRQELSTRPF